MVGSQRVRDDEDHALRRLVRSGACGATAADGRGTPKTCHLRTLRLEHEEQLDRLPSEAIEIHRRRYPLVRPGQRALQENLTSDLRVRRLDLDAKRGLPFVGDAGWTILDGFHPVSGLYHSVEALADLFQDGERTRIVMVSIMIGALLTFVQKGVGALIPVGVLLVLAFAIGDVCRDLGTGAYVAQVAEQGFPGSLVPAALFVLSGFIAFSTGTSFGTWAIMIPIAVPMALALDLSLTLLVAAVLGGGIFGDHCSPISDSTIVSSMAACTDHIDHVRTQLPYALVAAGLTIVLYVMLGFLLS